MKNVRYIIALALLATCSDAVAESISNDELQKRFNQAFSVFNEDMSNENLTIPKKQTTQTTKKQEYISIDNDEKNIVKEVKNVPSKTTPAKRVTETLTLPEIQDDAESESVNFINLGERPIFIDAQSLTLKQITQRALSQASYGETWTIKWRLKDENKYILNERMNLTAELNFDSFISNMLETITNITGIKLGTKVFNKHKIIIITDSF